MGGGVRLGLGGWRLIPYFKSFIGACRGIGYGLRDASTLNRVSCYNNNNR